MAYNNRTRMVSGNYYYIVAQSANRVRVSFAHVDTPASQAHYTLETLDDRAEAVEFAADVVSEKQDLGYSVAYVNQPPRPTYVPASDWINPFAWLEALYS